MSFFVNEGRPALWERWGLRPPALRLFTTHEEGSGHATRVDEIIDSDYKVRHPWVDLGGCRAAIHRADEYVVELCEYAHNFDALDRLGGVYPLAVIMQTPGLVCYGRVYWCSGTPYVHATESWKDGQMVKRIPEAETFIIASFRKITTIPQSLVTFPEA